MQNKEHVMQCSDASGALAAHGALARFPSAKERCDDCGAVPRPLCFMLAALPKPGDFNAPKRHHSTRFSPSYRIPYFTYTVLMFTNSLIP